MHGGDCSVLFHVVWNGPAFFFHCIDLFLAILLLFDGVLYAENGADSCHIATFDKIERKIEKTAEPEDFNIPKDWDNCKIPFAYKYKKDDEPGERGVANKTPEAHEADV